MTDAADIRNRIGHAQQGATRPVLFDAPAGTASAGQSIGHDTHVPELGARAEPTTKQAITGHNCSPHPGADGQHGHVTDQAPRPESELRPPSRVRIIVDRDVQVESVEQTLAQGFFPPRDVRRVVHHRLSGIDETGCRDPRSVDLSPRAKPLDHRDDLIDDRVRVAGIRRHAIFGEDVADLVDHGARDLRAADVDPDGIQLTGLSSTVLLSRSSRPTVCPRF